MAQQHRTHIDMSNDLEVQLWAKHLGITRDHLHRIVAKVGQSATAVRKELDFEQASKFNAKAVSTKS